jgi:hypothetical protein
MYMAMTFLLYREGGRAVERDRPLGSEVELSSNYQGENYFGK